jgi:hypothetical protein
MYPSLHLNLGEAYRRLSGHARARAHLDQGRAVAALADDGYGRMIWSIIGGLERLGDRLLTPSSASSPAG